MPRKYMSESRSLPLYPLALSALLLAAAALSARPPSFSPASPRGAGIRPGAALGRSAASPQRRGTIQAAWQALPLWFEPAARSGTFLARARGYIALLQPGKMTLELRSKGKGIPAGHDRVTIEFSGATAGRLMPGGPPLPGRVNYFLGQRRSRWRTGVPRFGSLRSRIAPGVALEYRGAGQSIEEFFRLAPGADDGGIQFSFAGAARPRLTPSGDIELVFSSGAIRISRPVAWQLGRGGAKRFVEAAYRACGSHGVPRFGFRFGRRDRTLPLLVDPTISVTYTTFFGGSGTDVANGVAVDATGDVYIGGNTNSLDFPETPSNEFGPLGQDDLFFAEINPTQSGAASLVWLTFVGGSSNDDVGVLAEDPSGNTAFLATTTSLDFPVTDKSIRHTGLNDLAVGSLDPTGALRFATYFGGNGAEYAQQAGGIAVDASGDIFITSDTSSTNLPVTLGAFRTAYGGGVSDGLLAEFATGGALSYCSYLGINAAVGSAAVAADAGGDVYLAGFTTQPPDSSFPALNAFQAMYPGGTIDGFVMKLSPKGLGQSDLLYATYLGGTGLDKALAIAVDTSSPPDTYVAGSTTSANFPVFGTDGAFQTLLDGPGDSFLTVIATNATSGLTSIYYSTYLGGSATESATGVVVTAPNSAYVTGQTVSVDFPAPGSLQGFTGTQDVFFAKFDPTMNGAASLVYSTLLGGSATASATSVAADTMSNLYVAGSTNSADYPQAPNPGNGVQIICSSCGGGAPEPDAFLTRLTESSSPAPQVLLKPGSVQFGQVPVGQVAPGAIITLENTGNENLLLDSFSIAGANSGDFTQSNNCPATVIPTGTCTISVDFTPSIAGAESATLEISDNAPGSPQQAVLDGTGLAAEAMVSPASISFGDQVQGTKSGTMSVTLTNNGNVTLNIEVLNLIGPDTAQFTFSADTCNAVLPAGASCSVGVIFAPMTTGSFSVSLEFMDNSNNNNSSQQLVPITGTGVAASPLVSLSTTSLAFGSQVVGSQSGAQTVTLQNNGSLPLTLSSISLAGTNPLEFALLGGNNACPQTGGTIAAGATCLISVAFAPQSVGAKSAQVMILDNAPGSPQLIALSGTGTTVSDTISPASLTFAGQELFTSSAAQAVTITNTGSGALTITSIAFLGPDAGDYTQKNNCSSVVNAGANCVVDVTFVPQAAGTRTASLAFTDNAPGSPQLVALTGTGIAPTIGLSPASVAFGGQYVGTVSAAMSITATNASATALTLTGITLGGTDPKDFSESDNCSGSIGANSMCTLMVTFAPAAPGGRSALLSISYNSPGSPQSVPLSGTGTDFQLAAQASGSTSLSVPPGQAAMYSLQLMPLDGFSGAVMLSCTTSAPQTTCAAAPSTLNVSNGANANFVVTATTTALEVPAGGDFEQRIPLLLGALLLFGWCVGWLAHLGAGRMRLRVAGFAGLGLLLLMSGCGGGGGGGAPAAVQGTPPGSYSVVLTASQNGGSHMLTLTLNVE